MTINKCNKCQQPWPFSDELFKLTMEQGINICLKCAANENIKSIKWYRRKLFAYHFLLYLPPCFFIGIHYGLFEEMLWIGGGVYILFSSLIRDWLASKF